MKIVRSAGIALVPASHEDPVNPGVLKRVLLTKKDLAEGRIQMINWAILPVGKSFRLHYHEDMEEIFILLSGEANIHVGDEKEKLARGDAVVIPEKKKHEMKNTGREPVEYIALGISREKGGKTVVVKK